MGRRGRLPSPNPLRQNLRPAPTGNVATGIPSKPRWLTGEAAAEWKRVVPALKAAGTLTVLDRAALVRYTTAWADWVEMNRVIASTGIIVKGPRGALDRNPAWFARKDAERVLDELGRQLALTPVVRIRAGITHNCQVGMQPPAPPVGLMDFATERKHRLLLEEESVPD